MIYIDTETTGLTPSTDRVVLFQYSIDGAEPVVTNDINLPAIHALLDANRPIVGHNLAFDFAMLRYIPDSVDAFEDTLYLSRLQHYSQEGHSLDEVCRRVLGRDPYAGMDKSKLQRSNWSGELTEEQMRYAATDVAVLPELLKHFKPTLTSNVYRFDKRSILAGLRIQRHGVPVLQRRVRKELAQVEADTIRVLSLLPFNPNSPKQCADALRVESTGDRVLAELEADGNATARLVREARGGLKYINFLEKLGENPRYFGTLQPAAKSGRFTSKKENIQNLPKNTKKFIGTDERSVIVSADFAQLELRTVAAITGDQTMIQLFKDGKDLHGYTAEQLFGTGYTKDQRTIAKVFNFATLYGASAGTIGLILLQQTGFKLSQREVQSLKDRWLSTYSGIAQWQRQGATRHQMGMSWRTPHGRPYVSKMMTDMLNIENQGAGAEVARIALHRIEDTLPDGARLVNFIHDSYIVECDNDPAQFVYAAQQVHDAMVYAWERAPFEKHGIPMPVDVGVAHVLSDADALENCLYVYPPKV